MPTNWTDTRNNETRADDATRALQPGLARAVGVVALCVLAAGQMANLAFGRVDPVFAGSLMREPRDLSGLTIRVEDGTVARLGGEGPTLVLVFDPDCAHSERIASSWAKWLSEKRPEGMRVFGVAAGSLVAAARYAHARQWSVELGTVDREGEGSMGQWVTKRTPWVFAVDRDGRVIAEGDGSRLREVARLLDEHITKPTP